jgi:hypothetical protein
LQLLANNLDLQKPPISLELIGGIFFALTGDYFALAGTGVAAVLHSTAVKNFPLSRHLPTASSAGAATAMLEYMATKANVTRNIRVFFHDVLLG